ncbi:hypothetical protein L6E12_16195 [Actinokineospora sp. PR83]|uniref:hypothetical protein n=1 Tax=Actinokineospora sp. PR83 TaxID=2884908 RepID=UPI001F2FA2A1|nr:hypothetical protein [Actinokineospora sp. PR83]MCG8917328.1 hypothetical protein [Actinokineospora sp. PR83]
MAALDMPGVRGDRRAALRPRRPAMALNTMVAQLLWWADALRVARATEPRAA